MLIGYFFVCRTFEPDGLYQKVIPGTDVGIPESMVLHWEYRTNPLNPLTWRIVAPRVFIQHIIVESLEHNSRYVFTVAIQCTF